MPRRSDAEKVKYMKCNVKIKKIIAAAVIFAAALAVLYAFMNVYVIASASGKILSSDSAAKDTYDCILVLGAGLRSDGTPSDMLKDRLDMAAKLYFDGASGKILVTGDNGRISYNEPVAMSKYLVQNKGVPADDIVLDYAGFSTYDSMYRAKEIFGAEKIVAVTQKYHLYRAVFVANALGLDCSGVACDTVTYRGQFMRDVRETAARAKDFISSFLKPKPKYLGEKEYAF